MKGEVRMVTLYYTCLRDASPSHILTDHKMQFCFIDCQLKVHLSIHGLLHFK